MATSNLSIAKTRRVRTAARQVSLQYIAGRPYFVFLDPSGEGYPLASTRGAYRELIYRHPLDPQQASDALPRVWVRLAARNLISTGVQ